MIGQKQEYFALFDGFCKERLLTVELRARVYWSFCSNVVALLRAIRLACLRLVVLCFMTRATLLHLLSAPDLLPTTAVLDLEQLAQAFPYCQTAHVLLAKAAHDQGNMLAGQRLRRAATYAADRQLLRQLLERPIAAPDSAVLESLTAETNQAAPSPEETGPDGLVAATAPTSVISEPAELPIAAQTTAGQVPAGPVQPGSEQPATEHAPHEPTPPMESSAAESEPEAVFAEQPVIAQSAAHESAMPVEVSAEITDLVGDAAEALPIDAEEKTSSFVEIALQVSPDILIEKLVDTVPVDEPEAVALPIRPSEEKGSARFEFGLNPPLEAGFASYQLPDLPISEVPAPEITRRAATGASFTGKDDLAYALCGGSRLGYALQAAYSAADADASSAAAQMPGSSLPLPGEFFAPDALLLEYLASQPPPAPPLPSSLELIDSFLRRAPQRRRGIVTLLTVPEQADLSMRSTQAESDLASESLARILAGQGKIERAITVYERLMVRQPEKSAYFAVQIELLRNPPTPSS